MKKSLLQRLLQKQGTHSKVILPPKLEGLKEEEIPQTKPLPIIDFDPEVPEGTFYFYNEEPEETKEEKANKGTKPPPAKHKKAEALESLLKRCDEYYKLSMKLIE